MPRNFDADDHDVPTTGQENELDALMCTVQYELAECLGNKLGRDIETELKRAETPADLCQAIGWVCLQITNSSLTS